MRVPFAVERQMMFSWTARVNVAVSAALFIALFLFEGRFDVKSLQSQLHSHSTRLDIPSNLPNTTRAVASTEKTSCLDAQGPQPFILMSLGRSGSGITFQILTKLTGMETPSQEYTGSSPFKSARFFKRIENDTGGLWVTNYLCKKQHLHSEAGLVGFKWKPWKTIYSPPALDGLAFIAQSRDPTVKIVRLRRNLLDVYLSILKHRQMSHVRGHCSKGDEACFLRHKQAGTNMTVPVVDALEYLGTMTKQEDEVDALLDNLNVPHVHVSYEKLYHEDTADEWIKTFSFLGIGPGEELTRQQVNEAMGMVPTSAASRRDSVQNFDELKEALAGTKYEDLLHRRL